MERNAGSTGFEEIAQMLLEQKKLMDSLDAENRELRRQLEEIKCGVGIAVVIGGKTIPLATEHPHTLSMQPVPNEQQDNGKRENEGSTSEVARSLLL